jgi:hypothetical protein
MESSSFILILENMNGCYLKEALNCREMWLSPVIQATGRQEQWDGSR